jgi:hypothetical protein
MVCQYTDSYIVEPSRLGLKPTAVPAEQPRPFCLWCNHPKPEGLGFTGFLDNITEGQEKGLPSNSHACLIVSQTLLRILA